MPNHFREGEGFLSFQLNIGGNLSVTTVSLQVGLNINKFIIVLLSLLTFPLYY